MAENDGYTVSNYSVKAEIERQNEIPIKFASMHFTYDFEGSFDPVKAKRYILASLESYCTTINSIRDSVKISYTIVYNGEKIAEKESIASGVGSIEMDGGACCL